MTAAPPTVAVIIVTYNRRDLLVGCLDALSRQNHPVDAVYVIDNASDDGTDAMLAERSKVGDLPLHVINSGGNLGGAGGFHLGLQQAYQAAEQWDYYWLMDDDVQPEPGCLAALLAHAGPAMTSVREDLRGELSEFAATRFDLATPWAIRPKRASIATTYRHRNDMPATVPVENVTFEGFIVRRDVVEHIGFPDPSFFIFYDDTDYAIRVRHAGYPIVAVRDAVMVRQLQFNQQHDTLSWKGFYMYRNLFVVHFRYGENLPVRLKPYAITAAVAAKAILQRRIPELKHVVRAVRSAATMRALDRRAAPPSDPNRSAP